MTLNSDSLAWAIEFIDRHSDGDIFPRIPEISAVSAQPEDLINALADKPLADFNPQPCRRFIVPKDYLSYRQATQLHPQDSVLLTAAVYQFGKGIEKRRLPEDEVFSYRFNPLVEHGLYRRETSWNDFWSTASDMSGSHSHVLYCDIADFYNQVYHHTVENQLAECGFPNPVIKWILRLLRSTTAGMSRGIPIGPHGAHLIAECTLIPIDNSLKADGIDFIRYADDLVIFCGSKHAARKALHTVATTLDKQQRLMLQQHKTQFFGADDFRAHCAGKVEDRPLTDDEKELLKVIRRYSGDDPYATVTYDRVTPEDWKAFSGEMITRIINEYLQKEEVDYIRLRWFFRRLAQVGHHGALQVIIENIELLEPCLPSICSYISSIQAIPSDEWKEIGESLLGFLEPDSILDTEFARLSILSLFSKNEHIDHFVNLAKRFGVSDGYARREILLAARTNSEKAWLHNHKESYGSMDPWQRMAFVYCISILPRDERQFFLRSRIQSHDYSGPFESQLMKWSLG